MSSISLRHIGTKRPFEIGLLDAAIRSGVQQSATLIRKDWESHGATYSGGIGIVSEINATDAAVGTNDQRVFWNNYGTRPHVIRARAGGTLAFPANYTPKTAINVIPSHSGGSSGHTVFAKIVNHPGTQARLTDEAIVAKEEQPVLRIFESILRGIGK